MEGEREEEGECSQSGETSILADTPSGESNESHDLHVPEEAEQADHQAHDLHVPEEAEQADHQAHNLHVPEEAEQADHQAHDLHVPEEAEQADHQAHNLHVPEEAEQADHQAHDLHVPEEAEQADHQAHDLHVPEEADQADHGAHEEEEVQPQQETLNAGNALDDADRLPLSPPPTERERTPSLSSHSSRTQSNRLSEPCWYCLRALESDHRPQAPEQQQDPDPLSPLPSSGLKVNYQTDPRPHFGIACSSHSTPLPLWGSDGPRRGYRDQELPDQTDTCPHCNLGLPPDTLRWHEGKCRLFGGSKRPTST